MKLPSVSVLPSKQSSQTKRREIHSAPPRRYIRPPRSARPQTSVKKEIGPSFRPVMTAGRREHGVEEVPILPYTTVRPSQPKKPLHRRHVSPLTARLVLQPASENRKQNAIILAAKQRHLATNGVPEQNGRLETRSVSAVPAPRTTGSLLPLDRPRPHSSKPLGSSKTSLHQYDLNGLPMDSVRSKDILGGRSFAPLMLSASPPHSRQHSPFHSPQHSTENLHYSSSVALLNPSRQSNEPQEDHDGLQRDDSAPTLRRDDSATTGLSSPSARSDVTVDSRWLHESSTEIRFKNEWQYIIKEDDKSKDDETVGLSGTPGSAESGLGGMKGSVSTVAGEKKRKIPSVQSRINRRSTKIGKGQKVGAAVGQVEQVAQDPARKGRVIHMERLKLLPVGQVVVVTMRDEPSKTSKGVIVHAAHPDGEMAAGTSGSSSTDGGRFTIAPLTIDEHGLLKLTTQSGFPARSPDWCTHLTSRLTLDRPVATAVEVEKAAPGSAVGEEIKSAGATPISTAKAHYTYQLGLDVCAKPLDPIFDADFKIATDGDKPDDELHLVAYQQHYESTTTSTSTAAAAGSIDNATPSAAQQTASEYSAAPVFLSVSEKFGPVVGAGVGASVGAVTPVTYQLHLTSAEVTALCGEFHHFRVDAKWCQMLLDRKQLVQLAVLEGRSRRMEAQMIADMTKREEQTKQWQREKQQKQEKEEEQPAQQPQDETGDQHRPVQASENGTDSNALATDDKTNDDDNTSCSGHSSSSNDNNAPQQYPPPRQTPSPPVPGVGALESHQAVTLGRKWMEHYLDEARVSRGPLKEAAMASAAALVRKLQEENSSEVASNAIVDELFAVEMATIAEQVYHELLVQDTKEQAATVIQSRHRSRAQRQVFVVSLEQHKQAAQKIQSACRGRLARRKYRQRYLDEVKAKKASLDEAAAGIDLDIDESAWQRHAEDQRRFAIQQAHARLKLLRNLFDELAVKLHIRPPYQVPIDEVVKLFDDSGVLIGYEGSLGQEIARVLEKVWREEREREAFKNGTGIGTRGNGNGNSTGSGSEDSSEQPFPASQHEHTFFEMKKAPTPHIMWRELRAAIAVVIPDEMSFEKVATQLAPDAAHVQRWMVKTSAALKRAAREERRVAQVKEDEERGRILRELQKHIRDIWNQLSLEQARRMWQKETVRRKVEVSKRRVWSMRTMAQQVDDGVTQLRSALTVWGIDEPKLFELLNEVGTYGSKSLLLAIEAEFNIWVAEENAARPAGQGQGLWPLRQEILQELSGLEQRCALYLLDAAHNNLAGTATEVQRQLLQETLRLPKESRQAMHHAIPVVLRVALAREKVALLQKLTLGFVDEEDENAIIVIVESCFDSVGTPAADAEQILEGLSHVMAPMTKTLLQQMLELMAGREAVRMLQLLARLATKSLQALEWVVEAFDNWDDAVHILGSTLAANGAVPCGLKQLERAEYRRAPCLTCESFWEAYRLRLSRKFEVESEEVGVRVDVEKQLMLEAAASDIQKVFRGRKARQAMQINAVARMPRQSS